MGLDRILYYLRGTVNLVLFYDYGATTSTIELVGFVDSVYANNSSDRCSTHGMIMILRQAACV